MAKENNFFNNMFKWFHELPTWAKGVIAVGAAAGTYVVGKKLYHLAFPSDTEKRNKELTNNIDSEIKKYQDAGLTPSYSDSQYNIFANTCYEGMRYAVGDNYGSVEDTLKGMNNDLDVAKLIKAFGFRQNYDFGIESGLPMDLFTFVNSELGSEWLGLTSYRVTSINQNWKAKGITYQI